MLCQFGTPIQIQPQTSGIVKYPWRRCAALRMQLVVVLQIAQHAQPVCLQYALRALKNGQPRSGLVVAHGESRISINMERDSTGAKINVYFKGVKICFWFGMEAMDAKKPPGR